MMMQTKRPVVAALEEILGEILPVLDHGFIRVIDYMGDDNAICQMARVSYGAGTKTVNEDAGLIKYLMRHRHTSPFEGCEIKLHLKMPIFIMRQWIRHRMANVNEYSARYSVMKDEFYVPPVENLRLQSKTNKQGSEGQLSSEQAQELIDILIKDNATNYSHYENQLDAGVSRELARIGLSLNTYTECYWKMDLHNLLHFCSLRSDSHAQKEIRDYSDIILHKIIKAWVPTAYTAFLNYNMYGKRFSKTEMELIKLLVKKAEITDEEIITELKDCGSSDGEAREFINKIR